MGNLLKSNQQRTAAVIFLIVMGFMVLVVASALLSDFGKLREVLRDLELGPVIFALVAAGISFLAAALSFFTLFRMTPYRIPFPRFFSIMFIADTMNFIISSAGMASIAIRAYFLKRENVPYSVTLPLTFAQNMIFNMVLSFVCVGGLFFLREHPELTGTLSQTAIGYFMGGLLLFAGTVVLFFLLRGFRQWLLRQIFGTGYWIRQQFSAKKGNLRGLAGTLREVESTVMLLQKNWLRLSVVFLFVVLNWCFMGLTFYFCFRAVGVDLSPGILAIGYTVMFLSSNVNPVPAGLGVSESLLAFTYKALGVGFEKALVAALVFRLVFYLIPMLISIVLFMDKVRSFLKSRDEDKPLTA
jgi:uncharacterized protein (TIRG00374 family)